MFFFLMYIIVIHGPSCTISRPEGGFAGETYVFVITARDCFGNQIFEDVKWNISVQLEEASPSPEPQLSTPSEQTEEPPTLTDTPTEKGTVNDKPIALPTEPDNEAYKLPTASSSFGFNAPSLQPAGDASPGVFSFGLSEAVSSPPQLVAFSSSQPLPSATTPNPFAAPFSAPAPVFSLESIPMFGSAATSSSSDQPVFSTFGETTSQPSRTSGQRGSRGRGRGRYEPSSAPLNQANMALPDESYLPVGTTNFFGQPPST